MTDLLNRSNSFKGTSQPHDDDHIIHQASKFIQLLESIHYPYEISEQQVIDTFKKCYKREDNNNIHDSVYKKSSFSSSLFSSSIPSISSTSSSSIPSTSSTSSTSNPTAKFLDWLIENVSAETNWPGYQAQQPKSRALSLTVDDHKHEFGLNNNNDSPDIDNDNDSGNDLADHDPVLESLDYEHSQLQYTLASLERELSDLKALEAHATDTNRLLDMDIHDVSIQFDATAAKLQDTVRSVVSQYGTVNNDQTKTTHIEQDQSQSQGQGQSQSQSQNQGQDKKDETYRSEGLTKDAFDVNKRSFIYQCQDELLQLHQMDMTFLDKINTLLHNYTSNFSISNSTGSNSAESNISSSNDVATTNATKDTSYLAWLFKRNPAHDQEVVRLCSTYRATKMSHIRAMAQLKALEEELRYMKELESTHLLSNENGREDNISPHYNPSSSSSSSTATTSSHHHNLNPHENGTDQEINHITDIYTSGRHGPQSHTIASSRNQEIQRTRQHEIELISVQRETTRLKAEMEQLLSDPSSSSTAFSSSTSSSSSSSLPFRISRTSSSGRNSLASSRGGTKRNSMGSNSNSTAARYDHENESESVDGVLVDICERIARTDIELEYLSAAHRDYLQEQERALKDLDKIVDGLLEYYSLGVMVDLSLTVENKTVQTIKDTLKAAVKELQEQREQSRELHQLVAHQTSSKEALSPLLQSPNITTDSEKNKNKNNNNNDKLSDLLKKNVELTELLQKERQTMQDHIHQMMNTKDLLDIELLQRHSSTKEIHSIPQSIHLLKDDLVKRAQQLQQDYKTLNDQLQQMTQRQPYTSL
ncbi:hypothetical protein BX616_004570 [Lobosporangium transversale]|uniref:Uncharacterized protein n=1 Tax=Lobosporangium transversale TaxID=64571 RepID=A0A1Y2G531_9FUNG|nr:hypothetical protein BCR41DRAFT_427054 [Lobosporangium transversale]KAF9898042.1 hypothetical protein BX616_004570 [Lobosporangium transversale]ORY90611.1 hypothetical protein BCR41DRAFT_427054 [Lobosporangium transversale]|eukprot:XP_021875106.1 hypothetical protein BCR41DRAFT_427054 [Lobosporangium transversale]